MLSHFLEKNFCIIFAILIVFVFVCLYFSCLSAQEAAMSQWGPPLVNNIQRCIETTQDTLTLNCHAVTAIADKSISLPQQTFFWYLCFCFCLYLLNTQLSRCPSKCWRECICVVSTARRSETITQRSGGARWTHSAILLTYHPHDCQHTLCTWYGIINHQ